MKQHKTNIYEKNTTTPIPIPNNSLKEPISRKYELHNQIFDPTHFSPPNRFIYKLNKRIEYYYNLDITNNNCVKT